MGLSFTPLGGGVEKGIKRTYKRRTVSEEGPLPKPLSSSPVFTEFNEGSLRTQTQRKRKQRYYREVKNKISRLPVPGAESPSATTSPSFFVTGTRYDQPSNRLKKLDDFENLEI